MRLPGFYFYSDGGKQIENEFCNPLSSSEAEKIVPFRFREAG